MPEEDEDLRLAVNNAYNSSNDYKFVESERISNEIGKGNQPPFINHSELLAKSKGNKNILNKLNIANEEKSDKNDKNCISINMIDKLTNEGYK